MTSPAPPPGPLSERLAAIERRLDELLTFATQVNVTATGAQADAREALVRCCPESCSCRS